MVLYYLIGDDLGDTHLVLVKLVALEAICIVKRTLETQCVLEHPYVTFKTLVDMLELNRNDSTS